MHALVMALALAGGFDASEWFALGSGCRAKFDTGGDVQRELLPDDPALPGYKHLRFTMGSLALDPAAQRTAGRDFARDCAVRLKLVPGDGQRIVDLVARTAWTVTKPAQVALTLGAELKLGSATLAQERIELAPEAVFTREEHAFALAATRPPVGSFPALGCGEEKLLGFDFTWIARPATTKSAALDVRLAGTRTLDLYVKLATCSEETRHGQARQ